MSNPHSGLMNKHMNDGITYTPFVRLSLFSLIWLLTGFMLSGQNEQDVLSSLRNKFTEYVSSYPREDVFIHIDRAEYIAGEEAFLSIYVLDSRSLMSSEISSIVYIELLNMHNVPVIQQRILLDHGRAATNFKMPDSLTTGAYLLKAYTNWMRNFFPSNCFHKEIRVFNLLKDSNTRKIKSTPSDSAVIVEAQRFNNPIGLRVERNDDLIRLEVQGSLETNIYTIIRNHGNIRYAGNHYLATDPFIISIPKDSLAQGVHQITLFNESGLPLAEEYIYLAPDDIKMSRIISRDTCNRREIVETGIETYTTAEDMATLSISVAPVTGSQSCSMVNYFRLGTEFGINPENVFGNQSPGEPAEQTMDRILADAGSRWINWKNICTGEKPEIKYPAEKGVFYISGQFDGTKPYPAAFLCAPGKISYFQYAVPDTSGYFRFAVPVENGLSDFVIMTDEAEHYREFSLDPGFADPDYFKGDATIETDIPAYIPKWSINYQVRKLHGYMGSVKEPQGISNVLPHARFYGKPDHELKLADFISLPLMEEVFFEILPNVSIRKREAVNEIVITDRLSNRPVVLKPALMIDGVLIRDPQLIIDLNPETVEKIEVVKEKYIVGKYVFPGIVNVITKAGLFDVQGNTQGTRYIYPLIKTGKSFNSPDYSGQYKYSRIPDYRNTLYWNAGLRTKQSGKAVVSFFSSDNPADYTIRVEGISKDGVIISASENVHVQ